MVQIEFIKDYLSYNAGVILYVSKAKADQLIEAGFAKAKRKKKTDE